MYHLPRWIFSAKTRAPRKDVMTIHMGLNDVVNTGPRSLITMLCT